MGDILSQNEIDELLNALNTGEIDVSDIKSSSQEKRVKVHDFRRPSKFAKDHLKTLNIIHDHYSRLVTNFLTGYLRTLVQVDVVTVETLAYSDFSNSITNPAVLAIVDFSPLSGSIIFEMAPSIAFAIIDRILGGKGNAMEKTREFTEIEQAIIERIIVQILNLMREPWANVIAVKPRLERIEMNPQFAQIISPNEMIALITMSARIGETEGMINICAPHMVVEPIVSKLSTKYWFATVEKAVTEKNKEAIENKIKNTKVDVKAILGKTTLAISDFLELQLGDVLQLEKTVDSDLEVMVGNQIKFKAQPGVRKNRVALRITEVLKKGDTEHG